MHYNIGGMIIIAYLEAQWKIRQSMHKIRFLKFEKSNS